MNEAQTSSHGLYSVLARVGYATKGLVYGTVGLLAVLAVVGAGGSVGGSEGAIHTIGEQPFGQVLLVVLSLGLFAYAGWRLLQATVDPENHGTDREGIVKRIAYGLSAITHALLGVTALQMMLGSGGGGGGTETWVAKVMAIEVVGPIAIGAAGVIAIGFGLQQLHKGLTVRFTEKLESQQMSRRAREVAVKVGRAGLAARAVVFCILGGTLIHAAVNHDPSDVKPLGEALVAIGRQPLGSVLLAATALGLMAYAVHQLVFARYRRIPS